MSNYKRPFRRIPRAWQVASMTLFLCLSGVVFAVFMQHEAAAPVGAYNTGADIDQQTRVGLLIMLVGFGSSGLIAGVILPLLVIHSRDSRHETS